MDNYRYFHKETMDAWDEEQYARLSEEEKAKCITILESEWLDIVDKANSIGNGIFFNEETGHPEAKEFTDKEKETMQLQNEIYLAKRYLSDTDYIITKIAEADTEEEREALREKYAEEIQKRKEARKRINEIEEELNS